MKVPFIEDQLGAGTTVKWDTTYDIATGDVGIQKKIKEKEKDKKRERKRNRKRKRIHQLIVYLSFPLSFFLVPMCADDNRPRGPRGVPMCDGQAYDRWMRERRLEGNKKETKRTLNHTDSLLCSPSLFQIYNLGTLTVHSTLTAHRKSVNCMIANERYLFTASDDHSVKVYLSPSLSSPLPPLLSPSLPPLTLPSRPGI